MSTLINNLKKAKYFTHGMIKLLPFMRTMSSNKLNVGSDEALKKHLFGSEANNPKRTKTWWEKPGIALMFQIEARPEWQWQRNYDQFNASITGKNGGVDQEGPIPQMKNWVAFSKRVGSDYHTFEAKWHDGLCYWNSQHTQWKTPVDYCWAFAKESRQAGIPYGFYYSSIFDHNPEFDDIQPLRAVTPSVIGMRGSKQAMIAKSYALSYFGKKFKEDSLKHLTKAGYSYEQPYPWYEGFAFNDFTPNPDRYLNYVIEQIEELCKDYGAELIWIDWYDPDNSGLQNEIMGFMKKNYPHTALTFNNTVNANLPWVHYLSGEGHGFDKIWTMIHKFRQISRHWELVSPATGFWDLMVPKHNPLENTLAAAITMAAGGKMQFGIASEMDGTIHTGVVGQMEQLGHWYKPRRTLFQEATQIADQKVGEQGIITNEEYLRPLLNHYQQAKLLHIFNMKAGQAYEKKPIRVTLEKSLIKKISSVVVAPEGIKIPFEEQSGKIHFQIPVDLTDPIDTIIQLSI